MISHNQLSINDAITTRRHSDFCDSVLARVLRGLEEDVFGVDQSPLLRWLLAAG